MDLDAFVAAHQAEWDELERLSRRAPRLEGDEAARLVELYQRANTHLSVLRSRAPDPALLGRLSTLVAHARAAVTSAPVPAWAQIGRFFTVSFPVAVYRARWWWAAAALGTVLVAVAVGAWVAANPDVQASIAAPEEIRALVERDFADYYTSNPAGSFAAQVWVNNAYVAALTLVSGALLCLPAAFVLAVNAANVGVVGGIMVSAGQGGQFFGLIAPHGLLELTAVFVAAGVGMRLGWTVLVPGPRPRGVALAQEGRAAVSVALGLVVVFLLSGVIEAFVTPSGLPTSARIAVGAFALAAFLAYVLVLGRRGAAAGDVGDLTGSDAADLAPYAA